MVGLKTAAIIALTLAALGCISQSSQQKNDRLNVVATIHPLYDMAKYVGGESAEVTLLIPPGSEVHSFEPTPDKALKLASADLFIMNGLGLEPWAEQLIQASDNKRLKVVDASQGIVKDDADPHVFQDPVLALTQLKNILEAYEEEDPGNAGYFEDNAQEYVKRLEAVDLEYRTGLADCKRRVVLVNHGFLAYPAARYGFRQITLTGLTPEAEPLPKSLETAVKAAREYGIKYVLYESTASPRSVQQLASEAGIQPLEIKTAHEVSVADYDAGKTYPRLLEDSLSALKEAMECGQDG